MSVLLLPRRSIAKKDIGLCDESLRATVRIADRGRVDGDHGRLGEAIAADELIIRLAARDEFPDAVAQRLPGFERRLFRTADDGAVAFDDVSSSYQPGENVPGAGATGLAEVARFGWGGSGMNVPLSQEGGKLQKRRTASTTGPDGVTSAASSTKPGIPSPADGETLDPKEGAVNAPDSEADDTGK